MRILQQSNIEKLSTTPLLTVSNKYQHLDSRNVNDTLVNAHNFTLEGISFSSLKKDKDIRQGKQKHVMVYDIGQNIGEGERLRLLVTNNYEAKGSLKFNLGIFRAVCANGIVVGSSLFEERLIHLGNAYESLPEIVEIMANRAKELPQVVNSMKSTNIHEADFHGKIIDLLDLKHGKNNYRVNLNQFTPIRQKDAGTDLWTKFNIAQEYLIKGLYQVEIKKPESCNLLRPEFGKARCARAVKSIDTNTKLNKACWETFTKELVAA